MPDSLIAGVDAAGPAAGRAPVSRPLVGFLRDVARYAARRDEALARRVLCSPFAGVPGVEARAIRVAAGTRRTVAETIEAGTVPLGHEDAVAARGFLRALERVERAQDGGAWLAAAREGFALDAGASDVERDTLAAVAELARGLDAVESWSPAALATALERLAREHPPHETAVAATPLAALEPEPARVVKRKRGHFSASSLGAFAACERRWYYRYVCAAVEDRGSSASFYGTAFHLGLERFHQDRPRADGAPYAELERELARHLGAAFERFRTSFETPVEYELQRRRALRTGTRYLEWFVERGRAQPFSVVGTEATVELELEGYSFIGYVDRLDRDDATGATTVVDYKTGSIAESADEYRENVASFVDFQLPFYYWARTAAGDTVTRLALVPLKEATRDVRPVELEVVPVAGPRRRSDSTVGTIGLDELVRARERMIAIAASLADGPLEHFPPTDDPGDCDYCAYRVACRERPLRRDDRFGR